MTGFGHRGEGTRSRSRRSSGQAIVELALITPVLLMILMGLVQFAFIFERQIGIDNAVREAARRTATFEAHDSGAAQTNANWGLQQLQSLLGNSQSHEASRDTIEVCILTPASPNNVDPSNNSQVAVRITESYRHPVFLPIVDLILDGIDGVTDQALKASISTEFHVEQEGSWDIGAGAVARWNGTAITTTPLCTP